jgi:hypothetical protein
MFKKCFSVQSEFHNFTFWNKNRRHKRLRKIMADEQQEPGAKHELCLMTREELMNPARPGGALAEGSLCPGCLGYRRLALVCAHPREGKSIK